MRPRTNDAPDAKKMTEKKAAGSESPLESRIMLIEAM